MASLAEFERCVARVQNDMDPSALTPSESLTLYGLHKQAIKGDAPAQQP
jgi:acyl-CoA-binding protein